MNKTLESYLDDENFDFKDDSKVMLLKIKSAMIRYALDYHKNKSEPTQIAQKNEFVIPDVSVSVCDHYFAAYFDSNGKICYKDCEFCGEVKHTDC